MTQSSYHLHPSGHDISGGWTIYLSNPERSEQMFTPQNTEPELNVECSAHSMAKEILSQEEVTAMVNRTAINHSFDGTWD